ncbi:SGNH/GDSL hydrolase family protein [Psychrobacter lutiphocae]|uniref:SGNH/GDSL hydrolase family protein n=2 Tax=Psychrobacter lutiphocae TaxID=540500 RepID=UPI000477E6A3|nr:SGNH/GDSL hydrolase family protein [Psychrobacter lutiphocae]
MTMMQPKDLILAPLYLYQGLTLKRTALRLPEATGKRYGSVSLSQTHTAQTYTATPPLTEHTTQQDPHSELHPSPSDLTLLIVGDSSAAGVGVETQQQALVGHLLRHLQSLPEIPQHFAHIHWSLHATSGHTSYDVLRRLYVLPKPKIPVDVMIVLVGVNDTTANVSITRWQTQLKQIIELGKRKFGAKYIIFPCVPPMQTMPAIPKPLNNFLGAKTDVMNQALIDVCQDDDTVLALPIEFANTGLSADKLFAIDGFHPNATAYSFLALKLAKTLAALIDAGELVNQ